MVKILSGLVKTATELLVFPLAQAFADLVDQSLQTQGLGAQSLRFAEELLSGRGGCRTLHLLQGAQIETRIGEQGFALRVCCLEPGRIQRFDLTAREILSHEGLGHLAAGFTALARHRYQDTLRHLRRDLALAHLLLNRFGQIAEKRQAARDPARADAQTLGESFHAQTLFPAQLVQQPGLLQRAERIGEPLAPVHQQSFHGLQVQDRGLDSVRGEADERPQALEAVDDHIAPGLVAVGDDHDRRFLALLGQLRQQAAFELWATLAKRLVTTVELVKFQVHCALLYLLQGRIGRPRHGQEFERAAHRVFQARAVTWSASADEQRLFGSSRVFCGGARSWLVSADEQRPFGDSWVFCRFARHVATRARKSAAGTPISSWARLQGIISRACGTGSGSGWQIGSPVAWSRRPALAAAA